MEMNQDSTISSSAVAAPRKSPLMKILDYAAEIGASDIHLCSGAPLMVRIHGAITPFSRFVDGVDKSFKPEDVDRLIRDIMPQNIKDMFQNQHLT